LIVQPAQFKPMKPAEFDRCLAALKLSVYASRLLFGVSLRQAQRFSSGERAVPAAVARLLRLMVEHNVDPQSI
jgi:hypothetical protein